MSLLQLQAEDTPDDVGDDIRVIPNLVKNDITIGSVEILTSTV